MKYQGYGGIRLKDYPGRCWESRRRMDAGLDLLSKSTPDRVGVVRILAKSPIH